MSNYCKENPETLQSLFGSIAANYDKTNAILSFRLHHRWNKALIAQTVTEKRKSVALADLCSGTGAIAFAWLRASTISHKAHLIDFSPEMLAYAKSNAQKIAWPAVHEIAYVTADVQDLPLERHSVDYATMAYGIRNVKDPRRCFLEVHRILKPGGRFGILELTQPRSRILQMGHSIYLKYFLPFIGKLATSNGDAYRYLSNSISNFSKPQELATMLQECGFTAIRITPLCGGIATILSAETAK